jgi:sugar phosphate isomerase/epimerase
MKRQNPSLPQKAEAKNRRKQCRLFMGRAGINARDVVKKLIILSILVFLAGCDSDKGTLTMKSYPEMKLGFTTQNFIKVSPVSVASAGGFIDYAVAEGYSWIELRDPDASLSVTDCEEISEYAKSAGIEVIYSAQRGLLDADFIEVFKHQARNTAIFQGPRYCRALAANTEFSPDEFKLGWSEQEFNRAVQIAQEAASIAGEYGLKLVIENSNGDIDGSGAKPYYGFAELLDNTGDDVLLQFDTANYFWVPQAQVTPAQVEELLKKYSHRLSYVHLKSAANGKALPALSDNPLGFEKIFETLDRAGCHYVAIELDVIDDEQQVYENHAVSLDYLIDNGFVEHLKSK